MLKLLRTVKRVKQQRTEKSMEKENLLFSIFPKLFEFISPYLCRLLSVHLFYSEYAVVSCNNKEHMRNQNTEQSSKEYQNKFNWKLQRHQQSPASSHLSPNQFPLRYLTAYVTDVYVFVLWDSCIIALNG